MPNAESRKSAKSAPLSPLAARLVSVTCLILVAMVLGLAWSRDAGNSASRERDQARLISALDGELQSLVLQTIDALGVGGAPLNSLSAAPADARLFTLDLNSPLAADDANNPTSAELARRLEGLLGRTGAQIGGALRGSLGDDPPAASTRIYATLNAAGFAHAGGQTLLWAMVPVTRREVAGGSRSLALIHYTPVDVDLLARVAGTARTGFVEIGQAAKTSGEQYSFRFENAGDPVFVSWKAIRPGDSLAAFWSAILISVMAIYTGLVAFFMTRKLTESEMENARLAVEDMLTGLPNRLLFTLYLEDEIARAKRHGGEFALLYFDLDRFKEVNDSFGHEAGDRLIAMAAQRISAAVRASDRVGRFGGDEFAIVQVDVKSPHECEQLADRLLKSLEAPFDVDGMKIHVFASIGITIVKNGAIDCAETMRQADLALHRAKRDGRSRYIFFDAAMNSDLQNQKRLEEDLRSAIASDELEVNYQPLVSSGSHRLCGVEALVRWNHAQLGRINPQEFVTLAEQRGLIADLGMWVLRRACTDAMHWKDIKLAVNVSALQFRHPKFVENIRTILDDTGFPPARLELEITEGIVIENADQAENIIVELRSMGIRIALDDFGTGYSSLIYLRRFAIDKIKIDQSFVDMMEMSNESMEIVRHVAHLGRRLGLTVTAEGAETPEQVEMLEQFGCNELQGYLFGKPMTALGITLLEAERRSLMPGPGKSSAAA